MSSDLQTKFLFDHVPKTGGTAFRSVLEHIFGPDNVSPWVSGRSEAWAAQRYADFRVVTGHFHSPIPGIGTARDRARITILRHPLDRLVSEYYYYRHDVERVAWNRLATLAKDHELYAYAECLEGAGDAVISNFYCRRFAAQLARAAPGAEETLSLAEESLSRYAFVGIQEQFVDTVDVFCCKFALPPVWELPRANVTARRESVSDLDRKTLGKLRELNRFDIALYEYALALFQSEKRKVFHRERGIAHIDAAPRGDHRQPARLPEPDGDRAIEILGGAVTGAMSRSNIVKPGEEAVISLEIGAHEDVPNLTVGIELSDELGEIVFGTNTHLLGESRSVSRGERYVISFSFMANMRHGRYSICAALHTGATHGERCFHWCERVASFDVADEMAAGFIGYCRLAPKVTWRQAGATGS